MPSDLLSPSGRCVLAPSRVRQPIRHGLGVGDHVQQWYATFVNGLDDNMLFELLLGANYLDLTPLLEICAATIGLRIMSESQLATPTSLTWPLDVVTTRRP